MSNWRVTSRFDCSDPASRHVFNQGDLENVVREAAIVLELLQIFAEGAGDVCRAGEFFEQNALPCAAAPNETPGYELGQVHPGRFPRKLPILWFSMG